VALAILMELNIRLTVLVVETARLERRGVNDINKQSMCARCKLQFGEHLIEQNAQNATNLINAAIDSLQNLITKQFF
jgi:hypothetical protein